MGGNDGSASHGGLPSARPTATVGDSKNAANSTAGRSNPDSKHHSGTTLVDATRQWLTPHGMAGMDKNGKPGAGGEFAKQSPAWRPPVTDLPVLAWPTPASRDYRSPNALNREDRGGGSKGEQLPNFVAHHWPTPTAALLNDGEHPDQWQARADRIKERGINGNGAGMPLTVAAHLSCLPQDQPTPDGPTSSPQPRTSRLRLSPIFGAWLMGWPLTWAIAEPHASSALATALWHSRLQQQLSFFFDAQG
jgi:hypothetical protein